MKPSSILSQVHPFVSRECKSQIHKILEFRCVNKYITTALANTNYIQTDIYVYIYDFIGQCCQAAGIYVIVVLTSSDNCNICVYILSSLYFILNGSMLLNLDIDVSALVAFVLLVVLRSVLQKCSFNKKHTYYIYYKRFFFLYPHLFLLLLNF